MDTGEKLMSLQGLLDIGAVLEIDSCGGQVVIGRLFDSC